MILKTLQNRPDLNPGKRTQGRIQNFSELLVAIGKLDLPPSVVGALNLKIEAINQMQGTEKEYRKALVNTGYKILKFLEKEHKIVPKNHYQKTWLALGMAVFGIPIGVAMGAALGNMGFIGAGIGMGLAIGIATGSAMDKKALKEGRQLEFEAQI
jgi:hypothetical protein